MENKKQGFFKKAFYDMKESAKIQAQVDKAEFAAKKRKRRPILKKIEERFRLRKPNNRGIVLLNKKE